MIAVLDHLGARSAVLAGHSMGGFVACVTAAGFPHRVRAVVLVDGGLAFPSPQDVDIDAAVLAVVGPAIERLSMTFPSQQAYLDFFRAHPALQADWSAGLKAYIDRDIVGVPPNLRSSCSVEAVRRDGADVLRDPDTLSAIRRLSCPATLLWAQRGLRDEPSGLYDAQRLAAAALPAERVLVEPVPDVNHYTVLFADSGARIVAQHIRKAAGG
jgi:pimeloyl-ACP methyl ester carboxylesterase